MQPRNLAARAGRWSATHRKTAIVGWILFVVLATVIGGKVGQQNLEPSAMGNGESKRGDMIVADAGFPETIGERVLIQGKGSIESGDPQVTAAVKDVGTTFEQSIPELTHALLDLEPAIESGSDLQQVLGYITQTAPSFSLRGGTREILRGIIARGLGLR